MAYDAWTAGTVLAPTGVGNMISLLVAGRLVVWMDQRVLLGVGCLLNALGLFWMSSVTLGMDYWSLAGPRFVQGLGLGLIFVPLTTLALATIPKERLGNATAAFNVLRNLGGSVGVAVVTTLLARRSQFHQSILVSHINPWDPEAAVRLDAWTRHFRNQGSDGFTAGQQALVMLYRETVTQAQLLAYADDFWLLALVFSGILVLVPLMRRVRPEPVEPEAGAPPASVKGLPEPAD
jgi:DHA2 family multidrug resistance protein